MSTPTTTAERGNFFTRARAQFTEWLTDGANPAAESRDGKPSLGQARMKAALSDHPLHQFFNFEFYDEDTGLFWSPSGVGFAFEMALATGADDESARVLANLFTQGLPAGTCVQFALFASPTVMPKLAGWASARAGAAPCGEAEGRDEQRHAGIFRALARKRVQYLAPGAHRSLLSDQPCLIGHCRLIVSVILPRPADSARVVFEREIKRLRGSIHGTLSAAGLVSLTGEQPLDAAALVDILDDIVNPRFTRQPKRAPAPFDPNVPLGPQIVHPETILQVGRDGLRLGDADTRCFSVRSYPPAWGVWAMSDMLGDFFQNAMRMPCPFLFTANVYVTDQVSARGIAKAKGMRATQMSGTWIGRHVPAWKERATEWARVTAKVDQGHVLCKVAHQLIVFAPVGEGDSHSNVARAMFQSKGWDLALERFVQFPAWLASLPMMFSPGLAADALQLGRMRTMLTWNVANLLPVCGEWRGTRSPLLLLSGRRRELFYLDPFDNQAGNYNIAVAAASGAGKSFLVQELVLSVRGTGGQVWVMDAGRSYERLARLIGGTYLDFGKESTINLNPFTVITNWDEDGLPMLKPLVGQMASPTTPLTDIQASFVEQALKEVWTAKHQAATITDVAAALNDIADDRARDIATQLYPFTKNGMHARYFEGEATCDISADFVVLELADLNGRRDLQQVVTLLMMMRIANDMFLGARDRRKLCAIDEAWRLMSSGHAGKFVEEGYRVARKHGGSFVTITQGINDYYQSDTARASLENADWVWLLRQKQESIDALVKNGRLATSEYMLRALKSLQTVHGKYSEMMISGPNGWSIARLVVDPFTEKLYSTQPDEFDAIERMRAAGKPLEEALDALVAGSHR